MFKFIKLNSRTVFLLIIYFAINLYIAFNLNYFSDDWTFFARNNLNFFEHNYENSYKIQKGVNREASIIFFYIINIFENSIFQNFLSLSVNFINFYLIYILLKKALEKNLKINNEKSFNEILIILIIIYFLFPFNIGSQYWLTNIHGKISLLFFLSSIILLINNKTFFSLIFLSLCFSSYEIFFFTYFFVILIFYYYRSIDRKDLKTYLLLSLIIQILFIFIKKRESHVFEIYNFIELFLYNFIRLIGSIYISISDDLSLFSQIIIFLPVIFYILISIKKFSKKETDLFIKIFLCILLSLIFNNILMTLGNYGYYGKGTFSRTMFFASFIFLLLLSLIFLLKKINKLTVFTSYYLLLITSTLFILEINLWKKSTEIQNQILKSEVLKSNIKNINRDLVLFAGPCYYKGVGIFNSYDINRAVRENYKDIIYKDAFFFPIQNWNGKIIDEGKRILYHSYKLDLYQYENVFLWNYYDKTFKIIGKRKLGYNKNYPNLNFKQKNCHIK